MIVTFTDWGTNGMGKRVADLRIDGEVVGYVACTKDTYEKIKNGLAPVPECNHSAIYVSDNTKTRTCMNKACGKVLSNVGDE